MTDQLTRDPLRDLPSARTHRATAGRPGPTAPRRARHRTEAQRGISSPTARHTTGGRIGYWLCFALLALGLTVLAVGPLLWMVSGSLKSTPELVSATPRLLPRHAELDNFSYAWRSLDVPRYLVNTLLLAAGALVTQLVVAVSAAYTFAVLRPAGSRLWFGLMVATLFVPATVIFIPAYVTVVDVPVLHVNLVNDPLAVWLPEAASAFNVFILKRFFDRIPREVIDAATVDGAGNWQLLRLVVLPMSRPILAVVGIFSVIASWKDFLWPKLTLPDPSRQPLSVALDLLSHNVELRYVIAAMVIASIPPVVVFLIFQRRIVGGLTDAGINR